ncbi:MULTISPECIES: TRAP transporter large permease [Halocynthiibacter]|uniref:TRAP transporter large permease n=1 Tax=Halocynthiibacter halioticoli TaxID=2986804 RepID=A0AAE3J1I0_9RHOB|nr:MULTISPECIES: TRAP transporter large permease [Halocynthiibacter]MCV6824841.1 TRAP transporter large permease [Halocynthiibacter halioticoli]MCW4057842.1 TRAP transporter large permease [Halocynthiibacter sp. SDUM655004]
MILGIGMSDPFLVGIITLALLLFLILLGVRVVFAAAFVGLVGLIELRGWGPAAGIVGTIPHSKSSTYALSVLPMFIFIGFLAFHAGMTQQLFDAARKWLGWMPGGLAVATVFATAGFAAVSGASTATSAVFSRVAIPEMLKYGYDRRMAAGVVASAGTLATLIPPSAILVIYAIIVEQSVGKLLLAGFLPGIFSAIVYAGIIVVWAMVKPGSAPSVKGFTWGERARTLPGISPILLVVVIIMTAIYGGWATPTEAGALGAFVVFILAIARGTPMKSIKDSLMESAKLTVMIFSLIWGVLIFVRFLGFSGIPGAFTEWIVSLDVAPMTIMICILLAYAVLGMFMDAIGMLLLTLPVVYPAVIALGFDPIWFGIIAVKMAEVCLITPPIGLNCFVVNGVRPDIPLGTVFRGVALFFVADVITIAALLMFPEIVTWLPNFDFGMWWDGLWGATS